jgi:dipeptidyl aminopeptidase/acylaminoacyl peptidase
LKGRRGCGRITDLTGKSGDPMSAIDPCNVVISENIDDAPAMFAYVETWDGLYAPIGIRKPKGDGPFPIVLLARGNGGEGMGWVRDALHRRGYIMDRLVEAGYACAWLRYRTEIELGYNTGGRLVRDRRQGHDMFNRAPLEYEDEIAIIDYVKSLPFVNPDRVGLVGVSHAGEMILKIASEFDGVTAAVACEPASHEFLALDPDDTAFVNEETQLRNIEDMRMTEVEKVRRRIDMSLARKRIESIDMPILVMGREEDHLQGIFRTTYDLLVEAGKEVEWVSFDHGMHGYIFPEREDDGDYQVDDVQREAIAGVIAYLDRYLKK